MGIDLSKIGIPAQNCSTAKARQCIKASTLLLATYQIDLSEIKDGSQGLKALQLILVECEYLRWEDLPRSFGKWNDATQIALAKLRRDAGGHATGHYLDEKTLNLSRILLLGSNLGVPRQESLTAVNMYPEIYNKALIELNNFMKDNVLTSAEKVVVMDMLMVAEDRRNASVSRVHIGLGLSSAAHNVVSKLGSGNFKGFCQALVGSEKTGTLKSGAKIALVSIKSATADKRIDGLKDAIEIKEKRLIKQGKGYQRYNLDLHSEAGLREGKAYVQIIDPHLYSLHIIPAFTVGTPYASLEEIVSKTHAAGGVNGGFFDEIAGSVLSGNPDLSAASFTIGGLTSNYEEMTPITRKMPTIGIWEDGTIRIDYIGPEELRNPNSPWSKVMDVRQSNQMVMHNGIIKWKPDYKIEDSRIAVGITREGKVVLINTTVRVTFYELAQIMKQLGCVSAINLDGGGSRGMFEDGKAIDTSGRMISDAFLYFSK